MAQPNKTENEKIAPIIIKRVKKYGGGHHGGAWKVAYADFVTAMMAFFLLLWLLNVTTEDQKNAISNYFDPTHPQISDTSSGAGGIMGGTSIATEGGMTSAVQPINRPDVPNTTKTGDTQGESLPGNNDKIGKDPEAKAAQEQKKIADELKKKEETAFDEAKKKLESEIEKTPDLKDLKKNLLIDITPEGLRIQIVDDQGRSMFARGSAQMYPFMQRLVAKVAEIIKPMPNMISVRGHTDSAAYKTATGYDNWNLSADRALATRRSLVAGGLPEARVANVVGRADREHLLPNQPMSERNRRISIILLRDDYAGKAKNLQEEAKKKTEEDKKAKTLQIVDDAHDNINAALSNTPAPASNHGADAGEQKPLAPVAPDTSAVASDSPSVPVGGLSNRTMVGVGSAARRGPVVQDAKPADIPHPAPTVAPEQPYVSPGRAAPTKSLQFD